MLTLLCTLLAVLLHQTGLPRIHIYTHAYTFIDTASSLQREFHNILSICRFTFSHCNTQCDLSDSNFVCQTNAVADVLFRQNRSSLESGFWPEVRSLPFEGDANSRKVLLENFDCTLLYTIVHLLLEEFKFSLKSSLNTQSICHTLRPGFGFSFWTQSRRAS